MNLKGFYDRLLKHFTNSIMDNAAGASSSSTFRNSFDKSNIYRIGEPGTFHNRKGDIAD